MHIRLSILQKSLFGCRCGVISGVTVRPTSLSNLLMKRQYSGSEEPRAKRVRSKMETAKIELTAKESQLRNLLLDVARYIDESKEIKDKIELRFAGGWVRDKLLRIPSHDIDTAINAMTGYNFSLKMRDYLSDEKNMAKHSLEAKDIGSLHKILANPEKSKHLETATTRIYGYDLDFVNLRKETYSEDSRNPQMEFGTAEEDALRRDATINALFYNIHTDLVEDFAGGLEDLKSRRMRTPLDPQTTFMDDPLRVLRTIRFASRLDFAIDDECETSMGNHSVMEALKLKISRERVGVEIEKMLKDKNARGSLQIIDRIGLWSTIFTDPTANSLVVPDTKNWHLVYDCFQQLESHSTPGSIYQSLVRSPDARYFSWMLVALTPWSAISGPTVKPGAKPPPPLIAQVAREGIKAESKTCSLIAGAFRNFPDINALRDAILKKETWTNERDKVGMSIRKWDSQGGHWRLHVLFALLVETFNGASSTGFETIFAEWQQFIDHIDQMNLMDAPSIKSAIDGKILQKALGAPAGTWMKPTLDVCMAWQLRNPEVTAADPEKARAEMIQLVREKKVELNIPI